MTAEIVRNLREQDSAGVLRVREAARFYGVAAETLRRALRGETWNELAMTPQRTEAELELDSAASLRRIQADIERTRTAGNKMLEEIESMPQDMKAKLDSYGFVPRKPT